MGSTCRKCSSNVSWSCDECCDGCSKESKGHTGPILGGFVCSCSMKNGTSPPEPVSPDVNEACFQKNQLKFATASSWIEWPNGSRLEFPLTKVTEGTYPAGSEWARNPIPSCHICDRYDKCGPGIEPNGTHDDAYAPRPGALGIATARANKALTAFRRVPLGRRAIQPLLEFQAMGCQGQVASFTDKWCQSRGRGTSSTKWKCRSTCRLATTCFHGVGTASNRVKFGKTAPTYTSKVATLWYRRYFYPECVLRWM